MKKGQNVVTSDERLSNEALFSYCQEEDHRLGSTFSSFIHYQHFLKIYLSRFRHARHPTHVYVHIRPADMVTCNILSTGRRVFIATSTTNPLKTDPLYFLVPHCRGNPTWYVDCSLLASLSPLSSSLSSCASLQATREPNTHRYI